VGFRTRNRGKASAKPRQKTREENQSIEERKSRAQIQSNNTPRTGGTGAKPRGKPENRGRQSTNRNRRKTQGTIKNRHTDNEEEDKQRHHRKEIEEKTEGNERNRGGVEATTPSYIIVFVRLSANT
jgi:hypothetical protein